MFVKVMEGDNGKTMGTALTMHFDSFSSALGNLRKDGMGELGQVTGQIIGNCTNQIVVAVIQRLLR